MQSCNLADIPTLSDAVHELHEAGCLYATAEMPAYRVLAGAKAVLPEELQWVSVWALVGQRNGFEWCECQSCGQTRLMAPPLKSQPSTCLLTYGCGGRMRRIAPRPRLTNKVKRALGMEIANGNRRTAKRPRAGGDAK
jgi:hypothetical protein